MRTNATDYERRFLELFSTPGSDLGELAKHLAPIQATAKLYALGLIETRRLALAQMAVRLGDWIGKRPLAQCVADFQAVGARYRRGEYATAEEALEAIVCILGRRYRLQLWPQRFRVIDGPTVEQARRAFPLPADFRAAVEVDPLFYSAPLGEPWKRTRQYRHTLTYIGPPPQKLSAEALERFRPACEKLREAMHYARRMMDEHRRRFAEWWIHRAGQVNARAEYRTGPGELPVIDAAHEDERPLPESCRGFTWRKIEAPAEPPPIRGRP